MLYFGCRWFRCLPRLCADRRVTPLIETGHPWVGSKTKLSSQVDGVIADRVNSRVIYVMKIECFRSEKSLIRLRKLHVCVSRDRVLWREP